MAKAVKERLGDQLEIQGLGRAVSLGQLYNASTSSFLNDFLFHRDKIVSKKIPKKVTDFEYKEVRSLEDRADSLEISASLSVSLLCGLIDIGGYGSYLERNKDKSQSTTIAATVRIRTEHHYLDTHSLQKEIRLDEQDIKYARATHVVTGITYGGNAVGSLTEKTLQFDSNTETKGSFNLNAFKDMARSFSARGNAKLTKKDKAKIDKYDLTVSYLADFAPDIPQPVKASELLQLVKKSSALVGKLGIPCEIILTPITRFNQQFTVSIFRELEDADLKMITDFFNRLINLQVNRRYILDQLERHYSHLFPSFLELCRTRSGKVDSLVLKTRKALRQHLEGYRSEKHDTSGEEFVKKQQAGFDEELKLYEENFAIFEDLLERKRAADERKFPLVPVATLGREMNRVDKATVALVVIPEILGTVALLNMYRVSAGVLKKWQDENPTKNHDGSIAKTVYCSIYTDSRILNNLYKLDGPNKTLKLAVDTAKEKKETALLTFGHSRTENARGLEWKLLNHDGWGVLMNKQEGWRYIGDVRNKQPHGIGAITYCNKTSYYGDWVEGERDGYGTLSKTDDPTRVISKGVFVDNRTRKDGVVVDARIYKKTTPINFARVALRKGDAISTQISKIARVFGWESGQKFRVSLVTSGGTLTVQVDAALLEPADALSVGNSPWPLGAAGEREIKIYVLD
ncbi:hypothetical protein AX17_004056 [Amanita inopinata Kibby_2008]|nr:hypothetical protein AX17_004056 [Amanita inopinata Kibby_2008]